MDLKYFVLVSTYRTSVRLLYVSLEEMDIPIELSNYFVGELIIGDVKSLLDDQNKKTNGPSQRRMYVLDDFYPEKYRSNQGKKMLALKIIGSAVRVVLGNL